MIGEHIDYCGYSVLPMAIEQNVKILAAPSGSSSIVIKSDVQARLKRDGDDLTVRLSLLRRSIQPFCLNLT